MCAEVDLEHHRAARAESLTAGVLYRVLPGTREALTLFILGLGDERNRRVRRWVRLLRSVHVRRGFGGSRRIRRRRLREADCGMTQRDAQWYPADSSKHRHSTRPLYTDSLPPQAAGLARLPSRLRPVRQSYEGYGWLAGSGILGLNVMPAMVPRSANCAFQKSPWAASWPDSSKPRRMPLVYAWNPM